MTIVYDVHAHVVPDRLVRDLRGGERHGACLVPADGGTSRIVLGGRVTAGPVTPALVDPGVRVERMDRGRVDVQLVSPITALTPAPLEPGTATRYARWFNECLAETVEARPDRLRGLATIPMQSPAGAASELRHAVSELGMAGCEITTTVQGVELDLLDLEAFWATAEELGCLVLLHPFNPLEGRGVTRYYLENLVGRPAESTIAVAHLILSGVLERHPGLRLCVVHGGGFLPYQIGRIDRGYRVKPDVVGTSLTRSPLEWARTILYDTVVHTREALAFLVGLMGDSHVVVGTDYPYEMGDPTPVDTVEAIPGLTDGARARILGGNVEALIGSVTTRSGGHLPPST
jgi:aminocarboxymuconate-semialdehyde decarboxylase